MPKRLLVTEGDHDLHAIGQLCDKHGIRLTPKTAEFHCIAAGGFNHLVRQLPTFLKYSSDQERVAIVVDGNSNPAGRWQGIRDRLRQLGATSLPEDAEKNGAIGMLEGEATSLTFGIWIMPDNSSPGAIEDFLLPLVKSPDLLPHVDRFIDGLPPGTLKTSALVKARTHAYLAVQESPGQRLGVAIKSGYFVHQGPIADRFVQWLRQVLDC